jgi:hypothetical protein
MRRRTTVALIASETVAVGAVIARGGRFAGCGTKKALPDEGAVFTVFTPAGRRRTGATGRGAG